MTYRERSSLGFLRILAIVRTFALTAVACGGSSDGSSTSTAATTDAPASESEDAAPANDENAPATDEATPDDDAMAEDQATADDNAMAEDEDEMADDAVADGERVEVRWFAGLGTGAQDEQIEAQGAVVDAFSASQGKITLVAEFADNATAKDVLATQIAAGNAPDIIGPVALEGSNAFAGQYADIEPLIEASGFNLAPTPRAPRSTGPPKVCSKLFLLPRPRRPSSSTPNYSTRPDSPTQNRAMVPTASMVQVR